MIDAVMGYLAQQFTEHLMTGRVHEQAANLSVTRKPTGDLYRTKDGWMVLAVMTEPQFQRLMKDGRPRRCARRSALPRLADAHRRTPRRCTRSSRPSSMKETSATWAERFAKADVPAGRVLSIPETVQLDHFEHRTVLQTVETEHGPIKVVGSGFRLEHGGGSVERPPATLGQHTDEVAAARRATRPPTSPACAQGKVALRGDRWCWRRRGRHYAWSTDCAVPERRRQVAGLGRRIATDLGDAAREVGARLRDLGEAGRGPVGEIQMPVGFAEVVARHGLPRRRDMGARLGNPRLVGRGAAQLGQAARPRAIVGILAVALGIFGEQPLGFEQSGWSPGLVDRRLELLALAIALAARRPQVGDFGAGLGRLGEARHLLVGFLQHRLGMA